MRQWRQQCLCLKQAGRGVYYNKKEFLCINLAFLCICVVYYFHRTAGARHDCLTQAPGESGSYVYNRSRQSEETALRILLYREKEGIES